MSTKSFKQLKAEHDARKLVGRYCYEIHDGERKPISYARFMMMILEAHYVSKHLVEEHLKWYCEEKVVTMNDGVIRPYSQTKKNLKATRKKK